MSAVIGDDASPCIVKAIRNAIILADGSDVLENQMRIYSVYGIDADDWVIAIQLAFMSNCPTSPAFVLPIVNLSHCVETGIDFASNTVL